MKVEFESATTMDIKLSETESLTIMKSPTTGAISFSFRGGHRQLVDMQNRSDGYSGASFSESKPKK